MPTKRQSAAISKGVEDFEDTLKHLISQIIASSRAVLTKRVDQIPVILENNIHALRLLNQAAQLVQSELNKCHRPKITLETEHRRALRRSAFSWELIPGLSSIKHNFTPLDIDDSDRLVELALKLRRGVLIIGNSGQGKSMLVRYLVRKMNRISIFVNSREADDLSQVLRRFTELPSAVLVLDNLLPCHCDVVRNSFSSIPPRSTVCVITTSDEVLGQLSELMCLIRIPDPCQQHMARLYTLLSRCVHSAPKCIVPSYRSRLSIVRTVQMELLDIQQLRDDFVDAVVDPIPAPASEKREIFFNKCLPNSELRKIERTTRKKTKGKKTLKKKPKKAKKKEKKKPKSRIKECFTI